MHTASKVKLGDISILILLANCKQVDLLLLRQHTLRK